MRIENEFQDLKKVIESAGKLASTYFYSGINPASQKDDGSIVTEIDVQIEHILRNHIRERFPDDTIVGEEGDTTQGTSGFVWFIDPIDGTQNFVRKIPFFAVTATRLGETSEDSFAIIHNPISNQTFASVNENGSYENEHLCNLTADPIGSRYFITVSGNTNKNSWTKSARTTLQKELAIRYGKSGHYNSALLELAYVAASRLDGFLLWDLGPWDSAAGLYLVRAAGGAISVFKNGVWTVYTGPIKDLYGPSYTESPALFVSHQAIHREILDFVGDPKQWADE